MDLCIDGLNEVTADTRVGITSFVEQYFKGNILLATQPLEWRVPPNARRFLIQPLTQLQIVQFLISRQSSFTEKIKVAGPDYEQACRSYLEQTLNEQQAPEVLEAATRVLSNPMDLTLVAHMLANGQEPDLFHLHEQQFQLMASDYKTKHLNQEFPLGLFSEAIYQMRSRDSVAIPQEEFWKEIETMEHH